MPWLLVSGIGLFFVSRMTWPARSASKTNSAQENGRNGSEEGLSRQRLETLCFMTIALHDGLQTATFRGDDTSETVEGLVEEP